MSTADYTVIGMTCHSCVANVTDELAEIPVSRKSRSTWTAVASPSLEMPP